MNKLKLILAALLVAPSIAMSAVTLVPTPVEDRGWQMIRGTSNVGTPYATEQQCWQAVIANAESRRASAAYRCVNTKAARAEWTATVTPPPPPPIVTPPIVTPVINAQLTTNRVTGVAPLAVQFDATGTTATNLPSGQFPFHHLRYSFNFGDERNQVWQWSGQNKNVQNSGPIAAYVYDLPGTYTARVQVRDANNNVSERTVQIQVQDPNVVYSGTNTICVSTTDFVGCPTGAAQVNSIPNTSTLSNRRVLLRSGNTFDGISLPHGTRNLQIGSFGTGAKPVVTNVVIGTLTPSTNEFPQDITIMNLSITERFEQVTTMSRLLFYRNTIEPVVYSWPNYGQLILAGALEYGLERATVPQDQIIQPRELFIVENQVIGNVNYHFLNMSGTGSQFVIMGNEMGTAQQHTIRIFRMNKGYIAHNNLKGVSRDGIRSSLKLHSGGLGTYNDNFALSGHTWASSQIVIANNLMGSPQDNNSFTMGVGPQNNNENSAEGVQDVVLENNRYIRGVNTNTESIVMGRRMTVRGNVRVDGGVPNINQFDFSFRLLPQEWVGPFFYQQ